MSYNNIGLSTARGSGTNGYIVKNNSSLQIRQGPPGFAGQQRYEDYLNEIAKPPVHRAPDAGILEHERKRQVEIKCLELQDRLEEEGMDEDVIEEAVSNMRKKLLESHIPLPNKRATDSHSVAAAKEAEMGRMRNALDIRSDHVEGRAFHRETDEERAVRLAEREERDRARAEDIAKREEEERRRVAEREEREKLRRREEYRRRQEAERRDKRRDEGRESRSPEPERRRRARDDSRSRSPAPRRRGARDADSRSPSRSRSPAPRRRGRSESRSPPPARGGRRDDDSRSRSPEDSRSPSPPPRRRRYSDSDLDSERGRSRSP